MEDFQFGQVKLTSNYKKLTYNTGETVYRPHKGIIRATYTVDNIDHTARVASYRYENSKRVTYATLYEESGIDPLEVEELLYSLIMKAQLRDSEAYYNKTAHRYRHTFSWLINAIWENRHWQNRKAKAKERSAHNV